VRISGGKARSHNLIFENSAVDRKEKRGGGLGGKNLEGKREWEVEGGGGTRCSDLGNPAQVDLGDGSRGGPKNLGKKSLQEADLLVGAREVTRI